MTGYPEIILPVHGQGIRLFIRRSGVDVNLVRIVGQAVRQVGQVPRITEHLAIEMQAYERTRNTVVWAI